MEQENSKFKKVLDYLKENYNISEYKLGQILSEKVIGVSIDRSTINKYKNGKLKQIPELVLNSLHELYHINPNYLLGTSDEMLDRAQIQLHKFESFVSNWNSTEKTYRDNDRNLVTNKYLYLSLDKNFYKLLLEINSAELHKEINEAGYNAHIEDAKKKYNNQKFKPLHDYVLIPKNDFFDIITDEKTKQATLDSMINYSKHFGFIDD